MAESAPGRRCRQRGELHWQLARKCIRASRPRRASILACPQTPEIRAVHTQRRANRAWYGCAATRLALRFRSPNSGRAVFGPGRVENNKIKWMSRGIQDVLKCHRTNATVDPYYFVADRLRFGLPPICEPLQA